MTSPLQVALESGVTGCARCGGTHERLDWHKFERPIETLDGGGRFDYWAGCPSNGDPILLWVSIDNQAAHAGAEPVG
jgi:hypothetical protein